MKRMLLTLGLVLSFAAGCGDTEGEGCQTEADCSGNLACGQLAICDEPGTCFGICTDVCDADEDCPDGRLCRAEAGGGRTLCQRD